MIKEIVDDSKKNNNEFKQWKIVKECYISDKTF